MTTSVIFKEPNLAAEAKQETRMAYKNPPFPAHVKPEITLVTPADATRYLATMHDNRVPSKLDVSVMEMNLREGTFFTSISVVYFDDADRPWDGQHRFEAIEKTGVPAYLIFIRGVTEEESGYIDTGRKRSFADSQRIAGVWDYKRQSVVGRNLALYDKFGQDGVRTPSKFPLTRSQHMEYIDLPFMPEAIKMGGAIRRAAGGNDHLLAYAIMRTAKLDAAGAVTEIDPDGFWEKVRTGENMTHGDPALTLNKYLLQGRARSRKPVDKRLMELYALTTSWNKHVLGQTYASVNPRFEVRADGTTYFASSSVPDFLSADADEKAKSALRNARTKLERERARANFMPAAQLTRNNGL